MMSYEDDCCLGSRENQASRKTPVSFGKSSEIVSLGSAVAGYKVHSFIHSFVHYYGFDVRAWSCLESREEVFWRLRKLFTISGRAISDQTTIRGRRFPFPNISSLLDGIFVCVLVCWG
jgi:hypothetical protein